MARNESGDDAEQATARLRTSTFSILWALLSPVLRGLLPYPDPARRRRVRRAASRLVVYEPWSADDATMGRDAAQLALLRILWLQKQ
ncbi:MAG TPA: hypothetical protein VGZ32_16990, partial [Actinocrinis sp.]